MPVNSHHKEYDEFSARWKRCRDCVAGEDAVKAAGATYLPELGKPGEPDHDKTNKAYRDRALFYNATARTLRGIVGSIFRKDAEVQPEEPYVVQVAKEVLEEVLEVGRSGVLVDAPKDGGPPYAVIYKTEDIINWRYTKDGDNTILEMVVLREISSEQDGSDEFASADVTRYRVLELKDGIYQQRVFKEVVSGGKSKRVQFDEEDLIIPTIQGKQLGVIPFQFFSSINLLPDVQQPPLIDLANVNLSHYRTYADLEHGRHFTALPTAWVAGFSAESDLRIGSGVAWVTEDSSANAGFLEFTGAGLKSLVDGLREKEALMAVLGARLLDTAPRQGVETAEALAIRQAADVATATTIANNVSEGMSNVFTWLLLFANVSSGGVIKLNTDLLESIMSPTDVVTLVSAWQQGGISQQTLLWNLKRGEVLPPDVSEQDEMDRIDLDNARFNNGPTGATPPDDGKDPLGDDAKDNDGGGKEG